jgi:nucleoside-diphosphate-sugar epimerase
MDEVTVIPICRTELGSTLLRKCGLECRHGEVSNAAEAKRLLAKCDLVADFTLPQATNASEIRSSIKRTISCAIQYAPKGARFVYASSIVAIGFGPPSQRLRHRVLARTLYGTTKRYGERLAKRLGRRFGHEVFVLRLGQVHGELQSTSRSMMQGIQDETAYVPSGLSYAVFAFTIAEALVNIARGKEKPGRYSLISSPDWSWKEVYQYYAKRKGVTSEVVTIDDLPSTLRRRFRSMSHRLSGRIAKPLTSLLGTYRETLTGYVLRLFPALEQRFRAIWGCRNAAQDVSQMEALRLKGLYRPFNIYVGKLPGARLTSLSDCRSTMTGPVLGVQRLLQKAVQKEVVPASCYSPDMLSRKSAEVTR